MYLGKAHDEIMAVGHSKRDAKEKSVLIYLIICRNSQSGACFPSIAAISAFTSYCARSVRTAVTALTKDNILTTTPGSGKVSTRYEMDIKKLEGGSSCRPPRQEVPLRVAGDATVTIEGTTETTMEDYCTTYSTEDRKMSNSFDDWMSEGDGGLFGFSQETPTVSAKRYSEGIEEVEGKKADEWNLTFSRKYYLDLREKRHPNITFDSLAIQKQNALMKQIEKTCSDNSVTMKAFFDNAVLNWSAIREKYKSKCETPEWFPMNYFKEQIAKDAATGGTTSRTHRVSGTSGPKKYEEPW